MTSSTRILLFSALALLSSCSGEQPLATDFESAETPATTAATAAPEGHAAATGAGGMFGPIIETMNSGGYTYVLLKTEKGEVWAAGPTTDVEVGMVVTVHEPLAMHGFHSDTLNRTFDELFFSSSIAPPAGGTLPTGAAMNMPAARIESGSITKVENGQTVEEVLLGKDTLVGKEVTVRGRVVKFTPEVMGKSWLHVQDGSGSEGTNDLTVTTSVNVSVGDVVLVKGILAADRDFGFGYKYDLIVEDATVTVE